MESKCSDLLSINFSDMARHVHTFADGMGRVIIG